MQAALTAGPRLIHWVARCDDLAGRMRGPAGTGIDPGEILVAERHAAGPAALAHRGARTAGARPADCRR